MGDKHKHIKLLGVIVVAGGILLGVAFFMFGGKLPLLSGVPSSADNALACANQGGTWNANTQICTVPQGGVPGAGTGPQVCTSQTYTINAADAYNGSTQTQANNLILGADNKPLSTFTQGTAITSLTTGYTYTFIPGITSSSFTVNSFGKKFTIAGLPCSGSKTVPIITNAASTSVTNYTYNQFGSVNNIGTNTMGALSSGQTVTVHFSMLGGSQKAFGNPFLQYDSTLSANGVHRLAYPNCACLSANSTWLDTSKPITSYIVNNNPSYPAVLANYPETGAIAGATYGGAMAQILNPLIVTPTTGKQAICFESEVASDVEYAQYLTFTTKAATAVNDNFTVSVYPANYFKDQYGNIRWDCNTDSGAAVGAAQPVVNNFWM